MNGSCSPADHSVVSPQHASRDLPQRFVHLPQAGLHRRPAHQPRLLRHRARGGVAERRAAAGGAGVGRPGAGREGDVRVRPRHLPAAHHQPGGGGVARDGRGPLRRHPRALPRQSRLRRPHLHRLLLLAAPDRTRAARRQDGLDLSRLRRHLPLHHVRREAEVGGHSQPRARRLGGRARRSQRL